MEILGIIALAVIVAMYYGVFGLLEDGVKSGRKLAKRNLARIDAASVDKDLDAWQELGRSITEEKILAKKEAQARIASLLEDADL